MNRNLRKKIAEETLEIVRQGWYMSPSGKKVEIRSAIDACRDNTLDLTPDQLQKRLKEALSKSSGFDKSDIVVVNETTISGLTRVSRDKKPRRIAVLNFASAKHPGGGFLNGSAAQEESLARSSALYDSLKTAANYYGKRNNQNTGLYSDCMILSPACPVFRHDNGSLLEEPLMADIITSAAPNRNLISKKYPHELGEIKGTIENRSRLILGLALSAGCDAIILGAWGCGVFGNDPGDVAGSFAKLLNKGGQFYRKFRHISFSILDPSPDTHLIRTFERFLN